MHNSGRKNDTGRKVIKAGVGTETSWLSPAYHKEWHRKSKKNSTRNSEKTQRASP